MNVGSNLVSCEQCSYCPIKTQFSCYHNKGGNILELNPVPVTNIIVQQFEICNHDRPVPNNATCSNLNYLPDGSSFNRPTNCDYSWPQPLYNHPVSNIPQPYIGINDAEINGKCGPYQDTCKSSLLHYEGVNTLVQGNCLHDTTQNGKKVINNDSKLGFNSSPGMFQGDKSITHDYTYQGLSSRNMQKNSFGQNNIHVARRVEDHQYISSLSEEAINKGEFYKNNITPVEVVPKKTSHVAYRYDRSLDSKINGIRSSSSRHSRSKSLSYSPKRDIKRRYRHPVKSQDRSSVSSKCQKRRSPISSREKQSRYSPVNTNRKSNSYISDGRRKHFSQAEHAQSNRRNRSRDHTIDNNLPSSPEGLGEKDIWTRTSPGDLYYICVESDTKIVHGTEQLTTLCNKFEDHLLKKPELIRSNLPKYEPLPQRKRISLKKNAGCHSCSHNANGSSCSSSSGSDSDQDDCTQEELEHKKKHPLRLHQELWFNAPGEMNDGPLCRCSARARRSGIRHNIYAGENHLNLCYLNTNNADSLFHYRITISPPTNFLVKTPTIIEYDAHEYIFEGFSMFSHKKLDVLPSCKVIRFNIEYKIVYFEEKFPDNFTIRELNCFYDYLFKELLELVDLDMKASGDLTGCPQYHFMPRFVRELPGNGKEILSMNEVLKYLLDSSQPLVDSDKLVDILKKPQQEWQSFTETVKGMIVTCPGKKPCSLRVDQLDRDQDNTPYPNFPQIVHFGIRPPQLSYAGNPEYQKVWRDYVKFRHLLANMPKPSFEDKRKLETKEIRLQKMRTKNELKRNVTVTVSSEHFNRTGIMCDIVQHAMLIPVLVTHLRFHRSLDVLESNIGYTFQNRYVLQLALTHPSYRENFGTNPDHARNSLTNCGIRQPTYGDRRIHYMNTRKRGINTLINIMSRFGKTEETESNITHNERLEFLGDAVVEFVTSIHLYHMFPELEEGGLATYRAAIVQNQHLAVLAKKLALEDFMLYAHGSDLCHDLELRHAMANCFEAFMGALFLDGGIHVADKVFGLTLFKEDNSLLYEWENYPPHPLQDQEPLGDRKWIQCFEFLQKLTKFEESIGVEFNHIRLLARAFTDRSIGFTNLTLGSNQRMEFLGDTVLQLIASEYLYKFFPEHHEGHLSLLRSSLVNNRTQAVVCNDLGMTEYALYSNPKAELKTKDRADLLEAFLGALYVDSGLEFCQTFCSVCFFPRLEDFIMHQDWNDPKSKLQQCCLTLRTMEGGEPAIPLYKVIECMGPTNTRIYTVAVYFRGIRLAKATGHSIQQAEMNAAKNALNNSKGLFPQLDHQKRIITKSMNHQQTSRSSSPQNDKKPRKKSSGRKKIKSTKGKGSPTNPSHMRTLPLAYQSRNKSESPSKAPISNSKSKIDLTLSKSFQNSCSDKEIKLNNCQEMCSKPSSTRQISNNEESSLPDTKKGRPSFQVENNGPPTQTVEKEQVEGDECYQRLDACSPVSSTQSYNSSSHKILDRDKSLESYDSNTQSLSNTSANNKVNKISETQNVQTEIKGSSVNKSCHPDKTLSSFDLNCYSKPPKSNQNRSRSPLNYSNSQQSASRSPSRVSSRRRRSTSRSQYKYNCRKSKSRSPHKYNARKRSASKSPHRYTYSKSTSKSPHRYTSNRRNPLRDTSRKRSFSRSPSKTTKSNRYPDTQSSKRRSSSKSPQRYSHRKRSFSRSPSKRNVKVRRSSREEARKQLMDFMLGMSKSPGSNRSNRSDLDTLGLTHSGSYSGTHSGSYSGTNDEHNFTVPEPYDRSNNSMLYNQQANPIGEGSQIHSNKLHQNGVCATFNPGYPQNYETHFPSSSDPPYYPSYRNYVPNNIRAKPSGTNSVGHSQSVYYRY